jgi:hypothetical protein
VIAEIRSLRQSIDSLFEVVANSGRRVVPPDLLSERIEEVFLSWANLRPSIENASADGVLLNSVDSLFASLLRLASKGGSAFRFIGQLTQLRDILAGTLNDFGIRAELLAPKIASPTENRLIAQISDLPNELVPRSLLGWIPRIREFLGKYPFENNVFLMVAYRSRLETLIKDISLSLKSSGMTPIVARDHRLTDDLTNPIACLLCCKYGIAIFDRGEKNQRHNSNVVYELAVMQFLQRPCALLKHQDVPSMPSDFNQKLYEPYRTRQQAVAKVQSWLGVQRQ